VLVYDSQSLQRATPLQPRVILYGTGQSGLTLSYSSILEDGGNSQAIEAMQFNPVTKKFDFFDIAYRSPGKQAPVVTQNPKMCLTCHRASPRPNWAKYDRWPGVYQSQMGLPTNSPEMMGFRKFAESYKQNPRYAPLMGIESSGQAYYGRTPAKILQDILTSENNLRISQLVLELPRYRNFKFAIAGAVDNAGDIEEYFPARLRVGKKSYGEILKETAAAIDSYHNYSIKRQLGLLNIQTTDEQIRANPRLFPNWDIHFRFDVIRTYADGYTHDRNLEKVAKLRYVVENIMGVSIASWAIALNGGSYTFAQPGWNNPAAFNMPDWSQLILKQDPEIASVLKEHNVPDIQMPEGTSVKNPARVEALRSRSLKALSK
jgi:hypothetical protein